MGVGVVVSLALAAFCPGEAIRVPLAYRPIPVDVGLGVSLGVRYTSLPVQKIDRDYPGLVIPKGASPRAVFGFVEYAGQKHLFMADADSPEAPFYNRAVYDANRNMELRDDPPLKTHVVCRPNKYYLMRAPVSLELKVGGQDTWNFVLETHGWGLANERSAKWQPTLALFFAGALSGKGRVGEDSYEFQIMDTSANGEFGDTPTDDSKRRVDHLGISRTGAKPAQSDRTYVSRDLPSLLVIGNRTFRMTVDPKGAFCSLTELNSGAHLTMPDSVFCGHLQASNDLVLLLDPVGTITLPEGKYSVQQFFLQRIDGKGFPWTIQTSSSRPAATLTLTADRPAALKTPEPFSLSASASRKGQAHNLCVGFSDAAGGALDGDLIVDGLQVPLPPSAKLLDKDGTVVKIVQLGYG